MLLVLSTLWLLFSAAGQSVPDQHAVEDPSSTVEVSSSAELANAVRNQTVQLIRVGNQTLEVRHKMQSLRKSYEHSVYCWYTSFNPLKYDTRCICSLSLRFISFYLRNVSGLRGRCGWIIGGLFLFSPFGCHPLMGERHSAITHTDE
jgi:hypothetical protein